MTNDNTNGWAAVVVGIILAVIILMISAGGCQPVPEPVPPTVTPTVTFPAPPPTVVTPVTPTATATARPTVKVPTWTPVPPTATATATVGAPTSAPTATPVPPTPIVLRGRVRVKPGDTLWGIACREYAGLRLRARANPLTPCTCWPGIALASRLDNPRLILPGWRLDVPRACIQQTGDQ